MEQLIAAMAGGAVALWFSGARLRRETRRAPSAPAARVVHLGAVDFLLEDAREAAAPQAARRRTDRAVARLEAMIRAADRDAARAGR